MGSIVDAKGLFAILFWYTVNIGTVILNKWIYWQHDFSFPITLTMLHMVNIILN